MRGSTKFVRSVLAVCFVGLFGVVSPASPAAAAVRQAVPAPIITVTPSTDLLDGQSVTVAGAGFSADVTLVSVAQLWFTSTVGGQMTVPVSGGSFSATFTVSRFVHGLDCVQATQRCIIVAANLDGGIGVAEEVTSASLTFLAEAAPGAPTIIGNATAGNSEATVSWTAPVSDGGSPITGYVVTPYIGYFALPPVTFNSTATTQVITGRVANGLTYRFRVQAINAVGTSGYSKVTNPVYPSTTVAPDLGAPTIIRNATAGGGWSATVSWTAPTVDGGSPVTGYLVTPYVGYFELQPYMFHSTATTQTLTGLYPAGATFRFRVQAVNAIGTGSFSTVTNPVTPSP